MGKRFTACNEQGGWSAFPPSSPPASFLSPTKPPRPRPSCLPGPPESEAPEDPAGGGGCVSPSLPASQTRGARWSAPTSHLPFLPGDKPPAPSLQGPRRQVRARPRSNSLAEGKELNTPTGRLGFKLAVPLGVFF